MGWVVGAGVGAGTGAVAAKIIDHGVSDEWVAWFRDAVASGTTTLALLVENLDPAALVAELERFAGARLVYANLDPLWLERMRTALAEPGAVVTSPPTDDETSAATGACPSATRRRPATSRPGRSSRPDPPPARRDAGGRATLGQGHAGLVADLTARAG